MEEKGGKGDNLGIIRTLTKEEVLHYSKKPGPSPWKKGRRGGRLGKVKHSARYQPGMTRLYEVVAKIMGGREGEG